MRRYFLRSILLVILAVAVTISTFAAPPPDPLAGGSTIVGDDYIPDFNSSIDNAYFSGTLKISASAVEMLKAMEGYLQKPASDYLQASIGYGCNTKYLRKHYEQLDLTEADMEKVLSKDYPNYILKEEKAEALMLYVLEDIEESLDAFLEKYQISINQYQYDALMSFTYNLGTAWMNSSTRLGQVLVSGSYTVNELASAMGVYCHVTTASGTSVLDLLVSRRIQEIKLFLYGAYQLDATDAKFCTVRYDAGDGEAETDIGFYQVGQPYQILFQAEPTSDTDLYFVGWYTSDGQKITANTIAEGSTTVTARWSNVYEDPQLTQSGPAFVPSDNPSLGQTDYTGDPLAGLDLTTVFSDMKQNDWHYSYVQELYRRGVIEGFPDATFRPDDYVTTGQALKMILLAAGYAEPEVVASHWARNFLNLALEEEIIARGEITDLDVRISRGLMAKIVVNSLGIERLYDFSTFNDTTSVYAETLYDYGISDGYPDGSFGPNRYLTRAELSAIVCRMYSVH